MKKIALLVICALLNPLHISSAAQTAQPIKEVATTKRPTKAKTKKAGTKKHHKKNTKAKSNTTQATASRTRTTTAGAPTAAAKTKKRPKAAKKTDKPKKRRTKTTVAGAKAKKTPKSTETSKAAKATKAPRAKKTTYKNEPTANKKAPTATPKKVSKPKTTRVYRKGGVIHREFNQLDKMQAKHLGQINKPTTQAISLNKPGRGYVNANLVNFTTPDGKEGKILLDTHNLTAKRAASKGITGNAKQSVEVYAGSDPSGKDLALIGEYALPEGIDQDVHVSVDPNGEVLLSGKNAPITKFSIHQQAK